MIYYISDTHFKDQSIFDKCSRPFISLNVIVCFIREESYPNLKHVIMIIGYISIIIFAIGFLLLRKEGKKDA